MRVDEFGMKDLTMRDKYVTWECSDNSERDKQTKKSLHGKLVLLRSKKLFTVTYSLFIDITGLAVDI
jgi:hypothetical protein